MSSAFSPHDHSGIFGIPPGCDFSVTFLNGLKERLKDHPPEALAQVEIYTNTQRAKRRWEDLLIDGNAGLLPQIRVVTDIGNDPILGGPVDPNQTALLTRLNLMQAVKILLESGVSLAPPSAAFELAISLQKLLDEMEGENVDPRALENLDVGEHSNHWQTALRFLQVIEQTALAADIPELGSDARQRDATEALAQRWAKNPPQHPVFVAGSTGSRGTTARLMEAVLTLPNGGIILPGFDFDLDPDSWEKLANQKDAATDHPQYGFRQLADRLGFDFNTVKNWADISPVEPARNSLISLAMCPAPVTDQWLSKGPEHIAMLPRSTGNLKLMEAPNERFEAAAIALALREAVEENKRAVLITPDATLSRRVTADLERWGIVPDDSAGVPLRFTPPAVFTDLVVQAAQEQLSTTDFLAILKHPLCATGWDRGKHLSLTRKLDAEKLRDMGPVIDWSALNDWASGVEGASLWVGWLRSVFERLTANPQATLLDHMTTHKLVASQLVSGPQDGTDDALWDKAAGQKIAEVFGQISQESDFAPLLSRYEYSSIFRNIVASETVREEGFLPDKRIAIWGQLEARVQAADLVILGGLNEGTWPKLAPPDPWLSRDMRQALGLQSPERRIGLSAHDFQQAIANSHVILSRAEKENNTPTVASRWLTRLENLLLGLGDAGKQTLGDMRARGSSYLQLAQTIEMPAQDTPAAPRPCPAPPLTSRPERISVTQVERLIRDPFSIYAGSILKLRPLFPIGRSADARDRGTSFHKVLENFVSAISKGAPPNAREIFDQIADETLAEEVPWPSERRLWLGRLSRIADSFIERERARQAVGEPRFQEILGAIKILDFSRELTLSCKADRIDVAKDGSIAIYDYKSSLPTKTQERLFSKQLELEAHMAMQGGFGPLGRARATRLEIIGLSKPNDYMELDCDPDVIAEMWLEFLKVMAHFEDPQNGYAARLRPMRADQWGDYDHLARRGEWEDNAPLTTRQVP